MLSIASAQTLSPGALDSGFNSVLQGSIDANVYATVALPDGKVLIGGNFTQVNGQARNRLARLNGNGSLDTTFTYITGADNKVFALALQPDGRIVVGGDFWSLNGANWRSIGRLNPDGSYDATFSRFTGMNGRVNAVAVQTDGKIVMGGTFTLVNGVTRNYLARLNTDGSLDTNFVAHADSDVDCLAIRPSGKILAGGEFKKVNNVDRTYLAQLNSDGSVDGGFNVTLDYPVYALAIQTNGNVVIGGTFGRVNGVWQSSIARLNPDGSRDGTFGANTPGSVYSLALQSNGRIVVAGRFSTMNSVNRMNIARLNENGMLDTGFDPGAGPDYTVRTLALQNDGKVIVGGEFANVNYVNRTSIARLGGDPVTPPTGDLTCQVWTAAEIGWNSQSNVQYQVQWSYEPSPVNWQNLGQPVTGNGTTNFMFDSTRPWAHKYYRVIKVQ